MSEEFNAKMKLLIKSEKALLALEMRKKSRQTIWIAMALVAVLVSLVMVNVTVFLYLETKYDNLEAAGILTVLNLALSGLFFLIASRQNRGAEAESIEDIRDFAWEQVSADIDEVKQHVTDFKQSVVKVKKGVDSFTSTGPLNKVMPIITTLIDLNKKR
ncbi:hypothetical protein MNB_SV-5-1105 [hydrothermal vent metagenome]|uniref:Uncharacterized protein n=1 Tax=hydrothermal vent metagenome TaxID=652676 RepID=A0A1W1EDU9_9ZZZZ